MKSRRTGIHEDRHAVRNEICGSLSDLVFEIDVGHGADHVIFSAVRRHSARKPYSAVESDDRALSFELSDVSPQSRSGNAKALRQNGRVYLSLGSEDIKDLLSSVGDIHTSNVIK